MLAALSTTSLLDLEQRRRLIKSTRKLAKVLGTTPRGLQEPSSSTSPTLSALYQITSRDSSTSFASSYITTTETSHSTTPASSSSHSSLERSMSAMASLSSGSSLKSSNSSNRTHPRRPKSPPSMYQSYDYGLPKPPKPLPKLAPKPKSKPKPKTQPKLKPTPTPEPKKSLPSNGSHFSSDSIQSVKEKGKSIVPPILHFKRNNYSAQHPPTSPTSTLESTFSYPPSSPQSDTTPTLTPMTPEFPVHSPAEGRRKRMDKLTRTLGEHIPTELIYPALSKPYVVNEFPPPPDPSSRDDIFRSKGKIQSPKPIRRASLSVSTFAQLTSITSLTAVLRPHSRDPSNASTDSTSSSRTISSPRPSLSKSNSRPVDRPTRPSVDISADVSAEARDPTPDISPITFSDHQSLLLPSSPPQLPAFVCEVSDSEEPSTLTDGEPRVTEAEPEVLADIPKPLARSKSYSHSLERPFRPRTAPESRDRPGSPFLDNLLPFQSALLAPPGMGPPEGDGPVVRRERRQGWSGEWNRDDMQDVIKKLRTLK